MKRVYVDPLSTTLSECDIPSVEYMRRLLEERKRQRMRVVRLGPEPEVVYVVRVPRNWKRPKEPGRS